MTKKKVIVIVGPTAAGKTAFAIKLAKKTKGEIISADSMQAYKGMDILSQAPTRSERKKIQHHLVGFLDPSEEYSSALFAKNANELIKGIIKKGKTPIIAGGSGLYIKALVDGLFPSRGKDEVLRDKLERLAHEKGVLFLYNKLKDIDPASANKIHQNDKKRIIRALEIYELEKKTKTDLKSETKGMKHEYDIKMFGLAMERGKLYDRINDRVDSMFKKGLVREVKRLLRKKLSVTSRQALGIKEIAGYLEKKYDLENTKEALKKNTRRFAKRQLTWFRPDRRIEWLNAYGKGITRNAKT